MLGPNWRTIIEIIEEKLGREMVDLVENCSFFSELIRLVQFLPDNQGMEHVIALLTALKKYHNEARTHILTLAALFDRSGNPELGAYTRKLVSLFTGAFYG